MMNKKIKIILLIIVIIIIGIVTYFMISYNNYKKELENINIVNDAVEEYNNLESYVFVDINPSLVLTIINNNINNVTCLNEDCNSFYSELDIIGNDINASIDEIYNKSVENGFDVNDVNIKSNSVINISLDYVNVEYIDKSLEKELLNSANINVTNENDELWNKIKEDSDYDKIYTCNMVNDELACFFIMDAIDTDIDNDSDYNANSEEEYNIFTSIFQGYQNNVANTFSKFNIEVINNNVIINNIEFDIVPLFTYNNTPYENVLVGEIIEPLPSEVCSLGYAEYRNGKCEVENGVYLIPLENFNLLNPSNIDNMLVFRSEYKDTIMQTYEIYKEMNG